MRQANGETTTTGRVTLRAIPETSRLADAPVLIARYLGEAWKRSDELDEASIATKDNNSEHRRIEIQYDRQHSRCCELEKAACFAQAETLEGAQVQLLLAAASASDLEGGYAKEIRAALASALSVLAGATGKTAADFGLYAYGPDEADDEESQITAEAEPQIVSSPADPLVPLCEEALALKATLNSRHSEDNAAWQRLFRMDDKIEEMPARSIAALAAKMKWGADYPDAGLIMHGLWTNLAADAEQLATGGASASAPAQAVTGLSLELFALVMTHDKALAKYLATEEIVGAEGGGAAYKAATGAWCAATDAALAFPSRTLADVMAKLAMAQRAQPDLFPEWRNQNKWLFADLERLAGGGAP
jgi:hypothetical protein